MRRYWPEAEELMETLMMKVKYVDEDGVDFYVTDNTVSKLGTNDKAKVMKAMTEAAPGPTAMNTDMNAALGRIFQERLGKLESAKRYGQTPRKMTLVVLTDGTWKGTLGEYQVDDKIVAFVKQTDAIFGKLEERPCTIEFIQFGDDPQGRERLRRLDDDLPGRNIA
jgi:hypothetical protein